MEITAHSPVKAESEFQNKEFETTRWKFSSKDKNTVSLAYTSLNYNNIKINDLNSYHTIVAVGFTDQTAIMKRWRIMILMISAQT